MPWRDDICNGYITVAKQFLFLFICHLDNLWGIGYEERGRMGLYNFLKASKGIQTFAL